MSEKIAEKLINIGSVQFSFDSHFILTSGLKSPVYVDCRRIISFVEEREFIMNEAINYFQKKNLQFDLVAGGETAGIPYASIIAEKTKKPMLYIRKKPKGFGKNQQIEGNFKKKENAILIEDLATDGGSKVVFFQRAQQKEKIILRASSTWRTKYRHEFKNTVTVKKIPSGKYRHSIFGKIPSRCHTSGGNKNTVTTSQNAVEGSH